MFKNDCVGRLTNQQLVGLGLGDGDDYDEDHGDDVGDDVCDDVGDDDDAGGDSFNENSFFAQPCRTCTWVL